ncbi:MAG: GntR family transcriptional regulator [Firmicutes bacterium]|jgi:GntR family transcriptional regulator|nr:GntR family transcriptional regulator [Bacillota bacterium]
MLHVDVKSSKPIYEQIKDQIKEGIIKGIFQPGDKLPSVRELSTMLTINPNTVSKAYQELEREKAIETVRGRGTFIVEDYRPQLDQERLQEISDLLRKVVVEAHYLGLSKQQLEQMVDDLYADLGGEDQ